MSGLGKGEGTVTVSVCVGDREKEQGEKFLANVSYTIHQGIVIIIIPIRNPLVGRLLRRRRRRKTLFTSEEQ